MLIIWGKSLLNHPDELCVNSSFRSVMIRNPRYRTIMNLEGDLSPCFSRKRDFCPALLRKRNRQGMQEVP